MKVKLIVLEPELEAMAGHLGAFDRMILAKKLERLARQLEASAHQAKQRSRKSGKSS